MSTRESLIASVTGRQEIDTSSGRVIFDKVFDTTKDIYMSFVIPEIDINILTEDVQKLLTENVTNITAEYIDLTAIRTGLVVFIVDADLELDLSNGDNGPGLGVLSYDTLKDNMSGHVASVAFDIFGGYSLSGVYQDVDTGYEALCAKTISSRVSSTVSEYQFLSSTTPIDDKVFDLNIDKKFLRFKFKDHLTSIALDYRNNIKDEYINVFKADTNINPNIKPKNVRIGIASSGLIKLPIKDITYSGTLSS